MRACLQVILAAVLGSACTQQAERTITPMDFYRSANMRTFASFMDNNLRAYCNSYPQDFFKIVKIEPDYLELLYATDAYWYVFFMGQNEIHMNEAIYGGSWRESYDFAVYFDEKNADWRAVGGEYQEKLDDCVPYPE